MGVGDLDRKLELFLMLTNTGLVNQTNFVGFVQVFVV